MRVIALTLGIGLVLMGCAEEMQEAAGTVQAVTACLEADAGATLPAGNVGDGSVLTTMGRRLSPVGTLAQVKEFPLAVHFNGDGTVAYVVHSLEHRMEAIDVATGAILSSLNDVGGFRGVDVSPVDGAIFATGETLQTVNRVLHTEAGLVLDKSVHLGLVTDCVLTADGSTLLVVSSLTSEVWELDPVTLEVKHSYFTQGVYPYAMVLSSDETVLWLSHVGDDTVTALERSSGQVLANLPVGMNPMGMALDAASGLLYVANSDDDSVTVVDTASMAVTQTVDMKGPEALPGGSPNELVLGPGGEGLYISFADLNRVEVYDPETFQRLGAIPTAHYPTGLAFSPDGATLAVVASKGWAARDGLHHVPGIISFVPMPVDEATLAEWTAEADENVLRTSRFWDQECEKPVPPALDPTLPQVIEHVVLIVRENKTYDALLGDFERGNGDPALVVFGEQYTPNLHELAEQFVNMDNFYNDAEDSLQGHSWATQGDINDLMEKVYPADFSQILVFSWDPSTLMAERTIFDHVLDHGLEFRSYGEVAGAGSGMFDKFHDYIDHKFPYFNMAIPDVWKAEEVVRELSLGIFPSFVYIAIPNDHTNGTKPGVPTPQSMVADNDEATGRLVEAISQSPYWDKTAIFIIEDDPQGYGGDHVHSHRSICVAVSPWVKRQYTSSVHYSIPALYRTMELLLRLPPMHKNDALAPPMYDIFLSGGQDEPMDPTPYTLIPRLIPEAINEATAPYAKESAAMNFSMPDGAEGLGFILWRVMNGDRNPPPYAKWMDE